MEHGFWVSSWSPGHGKRMITGVLLPLAYHPRGASEASLQRTGSTWISVKGRYSWEVFYIPLYSLLTATQTRVCVKYIWGEVQHPKSRASFMHDGGGAVSPSEGWEGNEGNGAPL